jgi:hypothetical protein
MIGANVENDICTVSNSGNGQIWSLEENIVGVDGRCCGLPAREIHSVVGGIRISRFLETIRRRNKLR